MAEDRESVRVLKQCIEVQIRKSRDYQSDASTVRQADYYPRGIDSLQDLVWEKVLRAKSLVESGNIPSNEALEDSYMDLINYASFAVAWLRKGIPGQDRDRDEYNRPRPKPVSIDPVTMEPVK